MRIETRLNKNFWNQVESNFRSSALQYISRLHSAPVGLKPQSRHRPDQKRRDFFSPVLLEGISSPLSYKGKYMEFVVLASRKAREANVVSMTSQMQATRALPVSR